MRMFTVYCPVTKNSQFMLDSNSVNQLYNECFIKRSTFKNGKEGYIAVGNAAIDFSFRERRSTTRRCSVYIHEGYVILPDADDRILRDIL